MTSLQFLLFGTLLLISFTCTTTTSEPPVDVAVYYESLCPDSKRFIRDQLHPTWKVLGPYMRLRFIPYGKARTVRDPDGTWQFTCQHGPDECEGNKLHGCALHVLNNVQDELEYVRCLMNNNQYRYAGVECAEMLKIPFGPIQSCMKSWKSDVLLYLAGEQTNALHPKPRFIPTIVINRTFDQEIQDRSLEDLKGVVCKHIKSPKPSVCQ